MLPCGHLERHAVAPPAPARSPCVSSSTSSTPCSPRPPPRSRGRPRARAGPPGPRPGVAGGDHAAEVEHDHVVAHRHHEVHAVLDQHHRHRLAERRGSARPARTPRRAPSPPAGSSSSSSSGSRGERAGERHALLHRVGQLPGEPVGQRPRSPPLERLHGARRSARARRGPSAAAPSSAAADARRGGSGRRPPSRSRARSGRGNSPTPCSVRAIPSAASWWAARGAATRRASEIVPALGATKPQMTLKSVVLPAPLGPITPSTSTGGDRERDAVERGEARKPHGHVLNLQSGRGRGHWPALPGAHSSLGSMRPP